MNDPILELIADIAESELKIDIDITLVVDGFLVSGLWKLFYTAKADF